MLLAFNLLIIIYPYPITSGLLWKELYINLVLYIVNNLNNTTIFSNKNQRS
ncbi:hypothetical protein [Wolbachia endosymbiont (group A) of Sphecodes monilicornis]|uniref:hypothetical protein n=1 Tax=Wolbachia endosymbiont (group A) of Sphecodes monilicornis TaxID=2954060 RepID=UPI0022270C93|nr:hypothetical protein [Wolbachia endosymbiont (group A) of Sphecodes monilicornis]